MPYRSPLVRVRAVLSLALAGLLTGCSVVFPSHRNSYDLRGEQVALRMLDGRQLCARRDEILSRPAGIDIYPECQQADPTTRALPALLAPLAVQATSSAIRFLAARLEAESRRYEAQFGQRIAVDEFWLRGGEFHHRGFELVRTTSRNARPESPAFHLVAVFEPSMDRTVLLVKPVYAWNQSAKAKVLARHWSIVSWFDWFTKATNDVEMRIDVSMDEIYITKKGEAKTAKLGAMTFEIPGYSLDDSRELGPGDFAGSHGGWLPPVRRSFVNGQPSGLGTFWLEARVTERDPSNARQVLKRSAEHLKENESRIVETVSGQEP